MKQNIEKNTKQLFQSKSSEEVMVKAFGLFKISKTNYKKHFVVAVVVLMPAALIAVSVNTVNLVSEASETILNTFLAVFGIVFTGYVFFQALVNDDLLERLLTSTTKDKKTGREKSKLQETNESFIYLQMLNIAAIIISIFLKISISAVNPNWILNDNIEISNFFACVFIECYFFFIATVLWELKSFVFNIFRLFNMHSGERMLSILRRK